MDKLKFKLAMFMQGRYGPDDLYKDSFIFYLILLVVNLFFRTRVISLIITLFVIWIFFRFFSKNISARQKENAKYLIFKNKFKNKYENLKKRLSDKEHVYRTCPSCRATLRFPKRKGEHDAICPKCRKPLKVKIR